MAVICVPEYPHKLTAQRNNPTAINIKGSTSHCETPARADQRKDTYGKAGEAFPPASTMRELLEPAKDEGSFLFFRGR